MTCRQVMPPARYSMTCWCEECVAGRARHRAACNLRLRDLYKGQPKPILSSCPNVAPGTTFSQKCPCDVCYERKRANSKLAHAAKLSQDIDDVVVHRMIHDPVLSVRPTIAERKLAALELRKRGKGANAIAVKIGVSPRTVDRYFRAAGLTKQKLRGPELREIVKARVLADPIVSFRELSQETGALPTTLSMHHAALVASGELPARDNLRTRNPRNGRHQPHA